MSSIQHSKAPRLSKISTAIALILSVSPLARGADDPGRKLDQYVHTVMRAQAIPGLSLAVIRDGRLIKAKGYGLANVETNTAATPETVYRIGSLSKQFVAAGIMVLVQQGKVSLSDTVDKYLEDPPPAWRNITVQQLLTHTSGLIASTTRSGLTGAEPDKTIVNDPPGYEPYRTKPDAEVIRAAYPLALRSAPGEQWAYSSVGYFILGEIIHKASGEPWGDFIAEHVFEPSGMTATRTTSTTAIVPHRSIGYMGHGNYSWWAHGALENAEEWIAVRPSGGFLSTVLDIAKWDAVLRTDAVLTASSRELMWTPIKLNNGTTVQYGFGWFLAPWHGHRRISHGGALGGFVTDFERFVDDKLTVIVMMNTKNANPVGIALHVAGFYDPALMPQPLKPIPDTHPQVTTRVREVLQQIIADTLPAAVLTPELAEEFYPSGGGARQMAEGLRSVGTLQSIAALDRSSEYENTVLDLGDAPGTQSFRYRLTFPKNSLICQMVLTTEGKIAGFDLSPE